MKIKSTHRFLAAMLAFVMVISLMPSGIWDVTAVDEPVEPKVYTLDANDLAAVAAGEKADGQTDQFGTENYFTIHFSNKTRIEPKEKTWDDGYVGSNRINFGGRFQTGEYGFKNGIQFTTTTANAKVDIWFVQGGTDNRQMGVTDGTYDGTNFTWTAQTDLEGMAQNSPYFDTLTIAEPGTYYVGGVINNNYVFKIVVTEYPEGYEEPDKSDWANVAAPEITGAENNAEGGITVNVSAVVGTEGGDKVVVEMYNGAGELVATKQSTAEAAEHTLTFAPEASGVYTFKAILTREGETEKLGTEKVCSYVLPLGTARISGAVIEDTGVVLSWAAVKEAESYNVYQNGALLGNTTELTYTAGGLTVGETYSFTVEAVRGEDKTMSDAKEVTIKAEEPDSGNKYVLDATLDLPAMGKGEKQDGESETFKDYFTIMYSEKNKIDGSNKVFDDGYTASQRLNFGGKTDPEKGMINSVKFTTANSATIKIWWVSGGADRQFGIYDSGCTLLSETKETSVQNALYISELKVDAAGTYYLGVPEGSNYLFKMEVTEDKPAEPEEYVLDATLDLPAMGKGEKQDGESETFKDFFTIMYSEKNKIDGSNKVFDDGYTASQRLNFGGKTDPAKGMINSVKFTTTGEATIKIWWVSGGADRQFGIYDSGCNLLSETEETSVQNSLYISELKVDAAGTYYLGVPEGSNYLFKMQVTVQPGGAAGPDRADWATVADPVITGVVDNGSGEVEVTVSALVGLDGGDEVLVTMYDAAGNPIATKRSLREAGEHTLVFTPADSGKYTFKVSLTRKDETDKTGADMEGDFLLPLGAPVISSVTSKGNGKMEVVWNPVKEAVSYNVYADGKLIGNTTELSYVISGLTVGQKYSITVEAVRGEDKTLSNAMEGTATEKEQRTWSFTTYGPSTNTSNNGYVGGINETGSVTVYSEGGKGKIQYKDSDGLSYYYTAVPEEYNFTMRVKMHVDGWKYSNGQEGMGVMVTDSVAPNGTAVWWSNQYMALLSKIEYRYDADTGKIFHTDVPDGQKYSMRLGLGVSSKLHITPENLSKLYANDASTIIECSNNGVTLPLVNKLGEDRGTLVNYNIVGNCQDKSALANAGITTTEEITDFIIEIQRNNTGYFITYYDEAGNIIGQQKNYDPKALSHLDTENVYVGFFASRNARATFEIEEFSTILASEDAPAEEKPITYVTPTFTNLSSTVSTNGQYTLSLLSNVKGTVYIKLNDTVLDEAAPMEAGVRFDLPITLTKEGNNRFYLTFTPDPDQDLGEDMVLENADPIGNYLKIQYNTTYADRDILYVSPYGSPDGYGTKKNPWDIYTAVKNVKAGQTIMLSGGNYKLDKTVLIQPGIDGEEGNPIRMIANPDSTSRPVLNFQGLCEGITAVGDYWYFQGFDVTNSGNGKPGFHVSGHNNVLDSINAYNNGNTGVQISRYRGTDLKSEWPSNNLVRNCTSYNNADAGYEDADGFAAKLTCGGGNVFDGCVAHHNADDGWDLYAKVDTGEIGAVTIQNCVAYSNGYLEDGTNAGNGNGFKMGGSNVPGAHKLINSYAFFNKAKGIDSNSGPNIIVENCTTYNNESYNVAFYTNINQDTNYQPTGIISFKDDTIKKGLEIGENLKPRGAQTEADLRGETNYYWNGSSSKNASGVEVTADMFVSLEFKGVERNADGTIDLQGFLQLKDGVHETLNAGAQPGGTASEMPDVHPGEGEGSTTPTDPSDPGTGDNPATGDSMNLMLWTALLFLAAVALVAIPYADKKRRA